MVKQKNKEHNHKKKYGQNFLDDKNLLSEIKENVNIDKNTDVIEIGPGLGFLTKMLIENSKSVTAFEIDDDLIPILKEKFKNEENFCLIHEDFLQVELSKIVENKNFKVIANIPYYITAPIINKLIEYRKNIDEIYLMVQKEVADRIVSEPCSKSMGIFTHAVQFYSEATYLFTVPREMFDPVPNVDSAFIKLKIRKDDKYINQIDDKKYFEYIKKAFSNKRKSLVNNLMSLGIPKSSFAKLLDKINKKTLVRAEELSIQEFIDLINHIENDKEIK